MCYAALLTYSTFRGGRATCNGHLLLSGICLLPDDLRRIIGCCGREGHSMAGRWHLPKRNVWPRAAEILRQRQLFQSCTMAKAPRKPSPTHRLHPANTWPTCHRRCAFIWVNCPLRRALTRLLVAEPLSLSFYETLTLQTQCNGFG